MLWVSKSVKRLATVLLTGDGGDDVFLGYPFFRNAWIAERLAMRLPAAAAPLWRATRRFVPAAGPLRRAVHFLDYSTGGLSEYAKAHDGLPYYERRSMLGERLAGITVTQRQLTPSLQSARRLLDDVFLYHRRLHFTDEFMQKVDGGTMHYAIESRSPLLDHKIWEFAATLPPEICFRGGALKAVLREIARRRIDPAVASRRKQGFVVPVERWLANRWSGMLNELRGSSLIEKDGWIRRGSLDAPLRDALASGRVPLQIWRLLILEHWMQAHGHRSTPSTAMVPQPALRN
jgi:asparagine synthase (glutamine-hydrolysing)